MTLPLTQQSLGTMKINSASPPVTGNASLTYVKDVSDLLGEVVRLPSPDAATTPDEFDWAKRAEKHYRESHVELLRRLSEEFGMAWTAVASVVGVSIPAIRKWRHGGDISDPNHVELAKLVAACEQLQELGVEWPASWLDRRVWPSIPRRFLDVAASDRMDLVLAYASGNIDAVELLNAFEQDWRERFPTERTEVTFDDSGRPTLHLGAADGP